MAKPAKGKDTRKVTKPAAKPSLAKITQYVVVSMAGLAGFVAYTSGASMEGALARVVVVLLLCTVIGYALNIFLWLSTDEAKSASLSSGRGTSARAARTAGTKLDLITGDEGDAEGEKNAPKATGTTPASEKTSA